MTSCCGKWRLPEGMGVESFDGAGLSLVGVTCSIGDKDIIRVIHSARNRSSAGIVSSGLDAGGLGTAVGAFEHDKDMAIKGVPVKGIAVDILLVPMIEKTKRAVVASENFRVLKVCGEILFKITKTSSICNEVVFNVVEGVKLFLNIGNDSVTRNSDVLEDILECLRA